MMACVSHGADCYPQVPPTQLVGHTVQGLVSHIGDTCFWLQRSPDTVPAGLGEVGDVSSIGVGECVVGFWEGDWCRGVVRREEGELLVVEFVDWGNSETLTRDNLKRPKDGDMLKTVGAVKCKLVDRKMEDWEVELKQLEYMVELRCLAYYEDTYLMTENLILSRVLPMDVDISGTVQEFGQDTSTAWFSPSSAQSSLNSIMDQLEQEANILTILPASHVFYNQMCATTFSDDGAMYRARITRVQEQIVTVSFIDYGNSEDKMLTDLFMLPAELIRQVPCVVQVDIGFIMSNEDTNKVVEETVVVKVIEKNGVKVAKIFVDGRELISGQTSDVDMEMVVEKLPIGVKFEVIVCNVDTVEDVWVTPVNKVEGVEACDEMVNQISKILLSHQDPLVPISSIEDGQMAMSRFSEDGLLYRSLVGQGGMVRFIDYGNGEQKGKEELYEVYKELKQFPPGAIKVKLTNIEDMKSNEANRKLVEKKLDIEDLFVLIGEEEKGIFFHGDQKISFSEPEIELRSVSVGKIIEVDIDEEVEDDLIEVVKTGVTYISYKIQVDTVKNEISGEDEKSPVFVIVNEVETVNTVWVTKLDDIPALEIVMDQLAEIEGQLVPIEEIHEGNLVVAKFSEDEQLYRGKLVELTDDMATVLFIDYGNREKQLVTQLFELPKHLGVKQALARRVRLEGVEDKEDNLENREIVDKELNKDGIVMIVNRELLASFWIGLEKVQFNLTKSSSGWSVGNEVTYWTKESKRWRRGIISGLEHGQATVECSEGAPGTDLCRVDVRHIKPAGMPLAALNSLEEELSCSTTTGTGSFTTKGVVKELCCGTTKVEVVKSRVYSSKQGTPEAQGDSIAKLNNHSPTAPLSPLVEKCNIKPEPLFKSESSITEQMIPTLPDISCVNLANVTSASKLSTDAVVSSTDAVFKSTTSIPKQVVTDWSAGSKQNAAAVFRPSSTIPQQMVTDWIAGCLAMLDKFENKDQSVQGVASVEEMKKDETKTVDSPQCLHIPSPDQACNPPDHLLSHPRLISVLTSHPPVQLRHSDAEPIRCNQASPNSDIWSLFPKQMLSFAQTSSGSQALQDLLDNDDMHMTKCNFILQSLLSVDLMELLNTPFSCKVVQKLCTKVTNVQLGYLVGPISDEFLRLSSHPTGHLAVLSVLAAGSQEQRDRFTSQLEDNEVLLMLLRDKSGSFVVQRCLPYLQPQFRTLACMVRCLHDRVVELGCHPDASPLLQEFIRQFKGEDRVDLLLEQIMENLTTLVYNDNGTWLVRAVLYLGETSHLTRVFRWMEKNIQEVLLDTQGVFVARTLVKQLIERSSKGVENCWRQALDRLVMKMIETKLGDRKQSLLLVAARNIAGHLVVQEFVRQKEFLGNSKRYMMDMLNKHKASLKSDQYGCIVFKGMQGWL